MSAKDINKKIQGYKEKYNYIYDLNIQCIKHNGTLSDDGVFKCLKCKNTFNYKPEFIRDNLNRYSKNGIEFNFCRVCGSSKKLDKDIINKKIKYNYGETDFKCIYYDGTNYSYDTYWECEKCGGIFNRSYDSVIKILDADSPNHCLVCDGMSNNLSEDIFNQRYRIVYNNKNITLIKRGESYDTRDSIFYCSDCNNHYNFSINKMRARMENLDDKCIICGDKSNNRNLKIINKQIKHKYNSHIKCLEYNGDKETSHFICQKSNIKFKTTLGALRRRYDRKEFDLICPICRPENNYGYYSSKRADKFKEKWISINCSLYIIEFISKNEKFFKVGISKDCSRRISEFKKELSGEYDIELIYHNNTNLYNSIKLENKIHDIFKYYKYNPEFHFGGHTECFNNIDINIVIEKIEELINF